MSGGGDLGGYQHAGFLLDLLHPGKAFDPDAFEAARLGAGFPDTGPEDFTPRAASSEAVLSTCSRLSALQGPAIIIGRLGSTPGKVSGSISIFIVVVDFAIAGCNRRIRSVYILFTDSVLFGSS